jgi:hypothetical protein
MGAVYLVEHADPKTRHAIKVLAPHHSRHPQIAQRFRNEACAGAIARSPNIVAVRDFGQLDDGCWYLVMDYWEGAMLSEFLASRGALPHELIIRIASDALSGLAAAHRQNIVHRDVCQLGDDPGAVTRNGLVHGTGGWLPYHADGAPRGQVLEVFRADAHHHLRAAVIDGTS